MKFLFLTLYQLRRYSVSPLPTLVKKKLATEYFLGLMKADKSCGYRLSFLNFRYYCPISEEAVENKLEDAFLK